MPSRLFLALACALLLLRLPSVVQPMGADQGLYAYVGERILAGDLPYRDAWDQKPPAIHYTYALMRGVWHGDAAVGGADLARRRSGRVAALPVGAAIGSPAGGGTAALLFLLLSNPAFTRLGGIRLRAQCETFIAVAVAGGVPVAGGSPQPRERHGPLSAPALFSGSRSSSSTTPGSTSPQAWRLHGCGGDWRG